MADKDFEQRGLKGIRARLVNNEYLTAYNFLNNSYVDIIRVNASNIIELKSVPVVNGVALATMDDVGGGSVGGADIVFTEADGSQFLSDIYQVNLHSGGGNTYSLQIETAGGVDETFAYGPEPDANIALAAMVADINANANLIAAGITAANPVFGPTQFELISENAALILTVNANVTPSQTQVYGAITGPQYQIKSMADATDPSDAVTKQQLDAQTITFGNSPINITAPMIAAGYIDFFFQVIDNSVIAFLNRTALHGNAAGPSADFVMSTELTGSRLTFSGDTLPGQPLALQVGDLLYLTYAFIQV